MASLRAKGFVAMLGAAAIFTSCVHAPGKSDSESTVQPGPVAEAALGFIESDGLRIHYEKFGAGRPLVLVHGWGADTKSNWVDTGWIEALKSDRLVISLDARGHGQSDKPHDRAAYSYSTMSRDVLALMDHLGIAKADYMGYSMGAFMGAYLLGHHGDRFGAMVLGGIGDESEESAALCVTIAEALRAEDSSRITNPIGAAYRAYASANPNNDLEALALSALQMWPEGHPRSLGGPGLGRARNPVLIVNGSEDHPYTDTAGTFARAIPRARVETIPGKDHLGAVSDPLFKKFVTEFLSQR